MKFNLIIFVFILLQCTNSTAQMFDYLEYLDKEKISNSSIGKQVENLYNSAEVRIKNLTIWELRQVQRVQKEILYESKDLPKSKIIDLKYSKFAELELLITTKEIDFDFWYLEQLDLLNDYAEENNIKCVFYPETQIQGRVIKIVVIHLLSDNEQYNGYRNKLEHSLTAVSMAAGMTKVGVIAVPFVEISSYAILEITDKIIKKIMSDYAKYFGLGMMTNAREVQLEKIRNEKL